MRQRDLLIDDTRLFEELCQLEWLEAGFKRVKKHGGSPGVDGVTIEEFESRLSEELRQLTQELESWTYQPAPVRRVEIPKPGGKGIRLLGVPTVRDRVVQATLKLLLEPIFEPIFSDHSYGFRPGRSQGQAVEAARQIVAGGKPYVVDIDLSKFFDRIHHDRLIARISQTIPDKRILRLIGLTLRSGVMINGVVMSSTEGSVQGSPLSPLLSNVVPDIGSEEAAASVCPQNRAYGSVHGSSRKTYPLTQIKPVRELSVGTDSLPHLPDKPTDRVRLRYRKGMRKRPTFPVGEYRVCRLTA